MFKLESYITPLLMSYVDKYIKNLKPEDSQFSLWGGDAVFSNLDLRLDVLEQELQLPFTFINGHIHELRIHIPWTKLGSEPVVITINTIECILKLCTDDKKGDTSKTKVNKSIKRLDAPETPPGYVQSLINKVINNICIVCNNLILKYVEDDIVLSLNIKSVELFSSNEKWDRAFMETTVTDTISRKVIDMQDLTVCLDKRDASGKIETYQDPLLYRCSSTWRIYSIYDSPHSKYPSLSRINMFCESLDFSLTDQQLPMFLRLLYLCIALHNKSDLSNQENAASGNGIRSDVKAQTADEISSGDQDDPTEDDSWGSWAWSFVPNVAPLWDDGATEEEQEKEFNALKSKKIVQFGIYIGKSSCILKHTVFPPDVSYCGPAKCSFSPLMVLQMYGCCMEFTSKGEDFVNVQSGICGVTVTGLEDCVCGYQDFSNSQQGSSFLKSGVPPGSGHAFTFLSSSLFDPLAPENCNKQRKYCFSFSEHMAIFTEEALVQRFPAFAFDYLYDLEIPEDWIDKVSCITSSFLEESNWHEMSTNRLVFGPLCLDVTNSLIHRLNKLRQSVHDYEYPYYAQNRKESVHPVVLKEETLEELEEFVPLRQYRITVFKPVLRLFVADHSPHQWNKTEFKKARKRSSKSRKHSKVQEIDQFFCLEVFAECLDWQSKTPMYPNRLVKIVEQASQPSQILLQHCYCSNSSKVFGLEVTMHEKSGSFESTLLYNTNVTLLVKNMILPDMWNFSENLAQKDIMFECSSVRFNLTEINFLSVVSVYQSWTAKDFDLLRLSLLQKSLQEFRQGLPVVLAEIFDIQLNFSSRKNFDFFKGSILSVCFKFESEGQISMLFNAPERTEDVHTGLDSVNDQKETKEIFLESILEIPKDEIAPVVFLLHMSGSTVYLEPAVFSWMHFVLFDVNLAPMSPTADIENVSTSSSITQEASASHSLSKSLSTNVSVSSKKSIYENVENFLLQHSQILSCLVLEIEIDCICGILPANSWAVKDGISILKAWQKPEAGYVLDGACVLCCPNIRIRNNSHSLQDLNIADVNVRRSLKFEKKTEDCFPWSLQLNYPSVYTIEKNRYRFLLHPTTISATVAFTFKDNPNHVSLCIHIDSKSLKWNFSAQQAILLVRCFNTFSVTANFVRRVQSCIASFQRKKQEPEDEVKSKCCAISQSDQSLGVQNKKMTRKLTVWMQFTLSKLRIVLLGKLPHSTDFENFKLQLDAEEIVSSLDIQEVYRKAKVKLSSLSVNCYTKTSDNWQAGPYEGRILFCNDILPNTIQSSVSSTSHHKSENSTFLVATYTQALHSNVKEKLTKLKDKESSRYISEIDLKVKSFGVILWISIFEILHQMLSPFIQLVTSNEKSVEGNLQALAIRFCAKNLPLLYIETQMIQLYIPDNAVLQKSVIGALEQEDESIVLLTQLDRVAITSQVENPLPRIIVNAEIYSNALNSKTVTVPGSTVEDRQYQIDAYGLAIGTIFGSRILCHTELKKEFSIHYLGENPALEWNIGNVPEKTNNFFTVAPIISPLNIRIVAAPAIVCGTKDNEIVVSGTSLEISLTGEVFIYLCLHQARMVYSLLSNNTASIFSQGSASTSAMDNIPSSTSTSVQKVFVPFEMLITAGTVSLMLFNVDGSSPSVLLPEEQSAMLYPFLCLVITQPHHYILCHPSSQKLEVSCFDFQVNGSPLHFVVKRPLHSCTPIHEDFTIPYLETKPGELHEKTGIPPAFFTLTCMDIFSDSALLKAIFERPSKIHIGNEICDAIVAFLCCLQKEFQPTQDTTQQPEPSYPMLLTHFKNMTLTTTQIVLEWVSNCDFGTQKLILSAESVRFGTALATNEDSVKSVKANLDFSGFTLRSMENSDTWKLLHPLAFTAVFKCCFQPYFQMEGTFLGESLLLNISLHHLLSLSNTLATIMEKFRACYNVLHSDKADAPPQTSYLFSNESKKPAYWSDDLRKGAFQFIQINDDADLEPESNEIVFNRASANQPASMTWCYPEPRVLTKIEVSPVPLQSCEDEADKKILTCFVQYWNSFHQSYVNFCDFALSETEQFSLNFPETNADAVSNRWRVLLDCGSDGGGEDNPFLSPLALAACMSIDSCFNPKLVPIWRLRGSLDVARVVCYNNIRKSGCSPSVFPFEFDDESPPIQEFSTLSFIHPSCSWVQWPSKMKGELSSGVTCEVLEYRNLTMLPVISPVDIRINSTVSFNKEKVPIFDVELLLQSCIIRLTQSVIHTLNFTLHSLSQEISIPSPTACLEYCLPNHYLICNHLEESIRFGQVGTDENIILSPLKMHAYSWWCHKKKQMLWISVGSLGWKWSKEFNIDFEGTRTVPFDGNVAVVIKIKKLSNLQKQLIVDGHVMVHSLLSFPIQLKYQFPTQSCIKCLGAQCRSPAFLLTSEQCGKMQLSVTAILDCDMWSESVAAGETKLISIPWKAGDVYQTVWCQMLNQKVSPFVTSTIIFLSPFSMVRSCVPVPLTAALVSPSGLHIESFQLKGCGQELEIASVHKEATLQLQSTEGLHIMNAPLQPPDSSISDAQNDVYDVLFYEIAMKVPHNAWPYSFLESQKMPSFEALFPCFEKNIPVLPAESSNQISFVPKISCSKRWKGLNTLLYELLPSVLLINRLGADLYLFDKNGLQWTLTPHSVAVPPLETFYLGILIEGKYYKSSPLVIETDRTKKASDKPDSKLMTFSCDFPQTIPNCGSVNIMITMEQKVFLFKLKSEIHNNIIVITAFPLIVFTNQSKKKLQMSLIYAVGNADNNLTPDSCESHRIPESSICHPLLFWEANSFTSLPSVALHLHVSFSDPKYEIWSSQVCLNPDIATNGRYAISVPAGAMKTQPMAMSSHWHSGMLFLVLNIDVCPLLMLHNRTPLTVFFGQSISDTDGKNVYEELQKCCTVPSIPSDYSTHYSFPFLLKHFPVTPEEAPMLRLGLMVSHDLVWSMPFKSTIDKQFVNVLGVCDFMVSSEIVGHTVNLFITAVNRIEVTANEVRSRIAIATGQESKTAISSGKSVQSQKTHKSISLALVSSPSSNIYFLNLRVVHISVIVCDEFREANKSVEILRLNTDNILFSLRPRKSSNLQDISLCFERIQLDNQVTEEVSGIAYDFPVILNRHVNTKEKSPIDDDDDPVFIANKIRENSLFVLSASVQFPNDELHSIVVHSLNVDLCPISLQIEDIFYYRLMTLFRTYAPQRFHQHSSPWSDVYIPSEVKCLSDTYIYPVHLRSFRLHMQEVSLSIHASMKLYLSLENSLLKFQPFQRDDLFTTPYEVGRILVLHYLTGALFRAGWVLGSLELLGNPAGFARAISTGMSDLVFLPYRGLLLGPRAFVSGLTNGALSLFTQVSNGAISCVASWASSISKNMDFLCMDGEHLARQELMRRNLPQGVSEGLMQGLSLFGLSVLGAVAGIVDHPLQVLVSPNNTPVQTASGIVGGFGRGIVGVLTKPIGGAAEFVSKAGYGFLSGAGWLNPLKRRYPPISLCLELQPSSVIKYLCKVALCQSLGEVLLAVEATHLTAAGEYEKNILLLTSEALCILMDDEVSVQSSFALTEIRCTKSQNDQSTLVIIPTRVVRKKMYMESGDVLDRVSEYLKKNSELFHSASDLPEQFSASSSNCLVFFLYPKDRNMFITLFSYAKSKALRKGFCNI